MGQPHWIIICLMTFLVSEGKVISRDYDKGLNETDLQVNEQDGGKSQKIHDGKTSGRANQRHSLGELPYKETVLSRPGSALTLSRVHLSGTRTKRMIEELNKKWEQNIPYVIDPSFSATGTRTVQILKRAIQRIMDYVCVVYKDVTTTWDRSNPTWFTDNGFQNNAYLLIQAGAGCSAVQGAGYKPGPINVFPCSSFMINTHEILHTLGGSHTMQIRRRDSYITVNRDNIQPQLQFTYDKIDGANNVDEGFDGLSSLLYSPTTWSRNGLEAYSAIRDDALNLDGEVSSDYTVFYELAKFYKCNERFCGDAQGDCGEGFRTIYKGVCQCLCPPEYDPVTNCTTLVNQPNSLLSWPKTPMAVLAGGPDHQCPDGISSQPGWFTFTGSQMATQKPVPVLMPYNNQSLMVPVCSKDGPRSGQVDWESWPPGGMFCFIKAKGGTCGGAFSEVTVTVDSKTPVQRNGSLGDIDIKGSVVTVKMCCKDLEHMALPIDLPNGKPFRLISVWSCPRIRGMREYVGQIQLNTDQISLTGSPLPKIYSGATYLKLFQCYYLPPIYGCNKQVTLNSRSRSATVTTPGFGKTREPNRRCLYRFKVPPNSKVRVTFNTYDLDEDDKLLVKGLYKWQEPLRIDNTKWPNQFLSEGDFLLMEYWSSWVGVARQGVNFTAEVLLPEDFCYNALTRGDDYYGDTSISETYEDCLPWSDTTDCSDFPSKGMNPIWLIKSGNKCRNPDGALLQPWCYTHRNGTNCRKRYCDVCNFLSPVDVLTTCEKLKKEDQDFCSTGLQRTACFKTCRMSQASTERKKCDSGPTTPSDGVMVGPLKSTYLDGEKVLINCSSPDLKLGQSEMLCSKGSWSGLRTACSGKSTRDSISTWVCEQILEAYPNFCSDPRFVNVALHYCLKTCGNSTDNPPCQDPKSDQYTRTSASDTITQGQTMTFTCKPGYYYLSGDLQRACSSTGKLLGTAPSCQTSPIAIDVNLNSVLARLSEYPAGLAMLVADVRLSVPFNGNISNWYYHCGTSGTIYFLIYRRQRSSYAQVGYNSVMCETGWRWSMKVPRGSQIQVQKGDIMGVYSPEGDILSVTDCSDAEEKIMLNPSVKAANFSELLSLKFSGEICMIPSLGYRVVPG